ncbi:MAG TPA: V-type ATP synthase subunit E family protein [Planctomycetota bacterium]|nr:V-type ATP synthase subunit E family protein [Planctomycetota bacterium]
MAKDKTQEDVEKVLSGEILADARRRGERTVKRAEREGRKLVDRVVKQAQAVREQVLERAQTRLERERQVFDSTIALEERMRRLKAQGTLLDEVFREAMTRLAERRDVDYRAVLRDLAAEAVTAMTGDAFVLHLNKADLASATRGLRTDVTAAVREMSGRTVQLTVADDPADIEAGVVVESADGRQRFDNSFAARLERMSDVLRFEVAEILFGSAPDETTPAGEDQP